MRTANILRKVLAVQDPELGLAAKEYTDLYHLSAVKINHKIT